MRMPDRATVATGTGDGNGEVDGGSVFSKTNNVLASGIDLGSRRDLHVLSPRLFRIFARRRRGGGDGARL